MKVKYNCPDCKNNHACSECPRVLLSKTNIEQTNTYSFLQGTTNTYTPNYCQDCPNHPSNGGDGVCFCVLPYQEMGPKC